MLQGRSESWGPQAFLDGAAIANTHTGPNEIGFVHLAHTFVVHLGAMSQWEVAINSDRKTTARTIPGSIDIAPTNSDVYARWVKTKNSLRVDISAERLQRLAGREFDKDVFELRSPECGFVDKNALTLALLMQRELETGDAYSPEAMDALVTICATHLLRNYSSLSDWSFPKGGLTPLRLNRVKDFVHANVARTLTTEEMAGVAGLSPSHFTRVFRQTTGQSPHQFVVDARLCRARALIISHDEPFTSIAKSAGFSSHSHMTAQMRRYWGLTPSEIRKSIACVHPSTLADMLTSG